METVNMHEAKTRFSKLVAKVERGETIAIARAGKPVARVVPIESAPPALQRVGLLKGQGSVPENWKDLGRAEIEQMFSAE